MLSLGKVSKWFGDFRALHEVDLSVSPGEVVGLVGANGAGKSTLIKVLGGLYLDADHSSMMGGRRLDLTSASAALAAGIGVVHQEIDLAPNFSVAEYLFLGREPTASYPLGLRFVQRRELRNQAERILRKIGFPGLQPNDEVAGLPIEMRQLVQVASMGRTTSHGGGHFDKTGYVALLPSVARAFYFTKLKYLSFTGEGGHVVAQIEIGVQENDHTIIISEHGGIADNKAVRLRVDYFDPKIYWISLRPSHTRDRLRHN